MSRKLTPQLAAIVVVMLFVAACAYVQGRSDERRGASGPAAHAQSGAPAASPVKALADRDVYYPGTEDLAPDEMRVVACGTGMPNARPAQAAACFLVELGNGDKFVFDIGLGAAERIAAQKIPYDFLDKVFIGHLHADHIGDLDALWVGGVTGNRVTPLRVWGPSGSKPEYGTKYMVDHMVKMYTWDKGSRLGNLDIRGLEIEVTEFDYTADNQVVYQENGVTIRSFPAIHALDGSVSFTLEWNGLKFAFSSDTYPNKWWMKHAAGSDIAIHECFAPPEILVDKQKFTPGAALNVGTQVHTSPLMFGKVMATIKPRMAVGYHFFNDFDTAPVVEAQVRETYDGPLELAMDYMVFNLTKDDMRVRMTAYDEAIWPQPATQAKLPPDRSQRIGFSKLVNDGRVVYEDLIRKMYTDVNKEYGTNIPLPD
ncbi:MAG: guanitoxin biosynthesis MBL fold metallo-hydrolase GntH [Planctomycetota bacterium]|jgi:ribonuclease Z